jgi:hypothetical protein
LKNARSTGNTAKNNTSQQRRATKTICTVNATSDFSGSKQTRNNTALGQDFRFIIDF